MPVQSPHRHLHTMPLGSKFVVLLGSAWLLLAAWPLVIAGVYAAVVSGSLHSSRARNLLILAVLLPALLAQVYWVKPALAWVMPSQQEAPPTHVAVKPTPTPSVQGSATVSGQKVKVVQVVDGATLDVDNDGQVYRVKLLGITVPAVATQSSPAACYGQESYIFVDGLARAKSIFLQEDTQSAKQDSQGNLLRHVVTEDGLVLNLLMLDAGLAQVSSDPHSRQAEYQQAAEAAKLAGKGLWGVCDSLAQPPSDSAVLGAASSSANLQPSPLPTPTGPSYTGPTAIPPVSPPSVQ